jgi:hypothetical protein
LELKEAPVANIRRYDSLGGAVNGVAEAGHA